MPALSAALMRAAPPQTSSSSAARGCPRQMGRWLSHDPLARMCSGAQGARTHERAKRRTLGTAAAPAAAILGVVAHPKRPLVQRQARLHGRRHHRPQPQSLAPAQQHWTSRRRAAPEPQSGGNASASCCHSHERRSYHLPACCGRQQQHGGAPVLRQVASTLPMPYHHHHRHHAHHHHHHQRHRHLMPTRRYPGQWTVASWSHASCCLAPPPPRFPRQRPAQTPTWLR